MTISIDGGGVFPDQPFPDGARLRVSYSEPDHDVNIYVEGGRIHVVGSYGRIVAQRVASNHVELLTIVPVIRQENAA